MKKYRNQGFTLIEIMIVLVIIAIMSSLAMLGLSSSSYSSYIAQVNKISAALNLLADEAVYTDSVIACNIIENTGFSCQTYKNGEWNNLNVGKVVSWAWPKDISVNLIRVNGVSLKEGEMIRFFPTGELPSMAFRVTNGVYTSWIEGGVNGDFEVNN